MFKENSDLDCSSTCTSEESGEDSTCSSMSTDIEGTCTYSNTILCYVVLFLGIDDFDFEMLQMQVAVGADDGSFDPFSSKIEAFVYLLMHSPKPIVSFCSIHAVRASNSVTALFIKLVYIMKLAQVDTRGGPNSYMY